MRSIFDTVLDIRELQMFSTILQIARLNGTLHSAGSFTVFAPHDRAFTQLSKSILQQLIADAEILTKIVSSHIIAGDFTYQELLKLCHKGEQSIVMTSIEGTLLDIDLSDGIKIGNSTVITTDIGAKNGTIHSIDRVILPDRISKDVLQVRGCLKSPIAPFIVGESP
jgi:uncharacterized surface protein with fasciclin (FAS1) repeats